MENAIGRNTMTSLLAENGFKTHTLVLLLSLVALALLGYIAIQNLSNDYKRFMVVHDEAIAGHLLKHNVAPDIVVESFTSEKTNEDLIAGKPLLSASGYVPDLDMALFPEVERLSRATLSFFLYAFVCVTTFILCFHTHFYRQKQQTLLRASSELIKMMNGTRSVWFLEHSEGSLSRLLETVDNVATSLRSHIEKETRQQELLKETLSDISHQIKTPLSALHLYLDIIETEQIQNPTVERFLNASYRELQRVEALVYHLLELARLDSGTVEIVLKIHPLRIMLEECVAEFQTRAEIENKSLILTCDTSVQLRCDDRWLSEAIGNIIKNALDHTHDGGRVEVCCEQSPLITEITIRDNGSGIHPHDLPYIFKRFYRSPYTNERYGIGIGLSLSKAIVEKHHGSITVESVLGKGTTFRLTFGNLSNV
jgi:signal transduction histidine kinase